MHLHSTGMRYAVFTAFNFSDLPQNNWEFNVEAVMSGGAISVKAYQHLSASTYYFRAVTVAGEWASYWQKFTFGQDIKYKTITLGFASANKMYAEINSTEISNSVPISLAIHKISQTPYEYITFATVIKIDDIIKCAVYSDGRFVDGHILSASIAYL